ncbi:hypothetical protein LCGC14_2454670, partial [marine sediment metagenome]
GLTPPQLGFNYFSVPGKGLFNSTIWADNAIFSNPTLKSFVLNVPGTYPAWKINGEMFTGLMSPELSTYPEKLKEKYKKDWIVGGNTIELLHKAFKMRSNLFLSRFKEDFDLMIYVIDIPDHTSHIAYLSLKDMIHYIHLDYKKIDKFLGRILDNKEFKNLFIISDHGLSTNKKIFYFNYWLKKKGFFSFPSQSNEKIWKGIFLKLFGIIRPLIKPNKNLIKIYERLLLKPKKSNKNSKQGENEKKNLVRPQATFYIPDIMRLRTYKSNVGGIYLYGNYRSKKEVIISALNKEKCVKRIITPEFESFPDIYIILRPDMFFSVESSLFLKRKTEIMSHSMNGLFIAYGKNIKPGRATYVQYFDFAPTVLQLFNLEKQKGMIGESLNILK